MNPQSPIFSEEFRNEFIQLLAWRRDVRRFSTAPVEAALIERLLDLAQLAPSVGNSQPWRWVEVSSAARRAAIRANFSAANAKALAAQSADRASLYASLKLQGLDNAPRHFAVFCDNATAQGHGLGTRTMPEMLEASVCGMVNTFWLAARAHGLGVGWVSILDPLQATQTLEVPPAWKLVAYLCVGWPIEEHLDPELVRHNWQARTRAGRQVLAR
ncbi:MAG: 5,6-dimethylbenzimidazole synthase [Hyphomicrobiales bacterium]|nr:5,6-dimethylbenzimidazole synthase [Hyphomicrobiales bacterium]MDE2114709.1 5,6-dimethylbenzimidazole synthase [Hyphomicrobiales bacterium]